MKRLLLVDDDALMIRSYRDRLAGHGFQVNTAGSGTAALSILRSVKPDLVVLDLMMPDLSGVEVLKYIRSESRLAPTPVVVLTNAYLNDLGRQAADIGVQKALLKAQCSPSVLMAVIDVILDPRLAAAKPSPPEAEPEPEASAMPVAPPCPTALPQPAAPVAAASVDTEESETENGESLLAAAPQICAELRERFQALTRAPGNAPEQQRQLQGLFSLVHSLAAAAGQTKFAHLAQAAAVFDALLYVLMENSKRISPSVLRTLASLVDFVKVLFQNAQEARLGNPSSARVLVVDDDPVSNQVVVSALAQAHLNTRSTENPLTAWDWISCEQFSLVLLDMEMPELNGLELCKRLRKLPGYEKTPVIFVTVHTNFESRAGASLSGADDVIAKPVLPAELAAKVVMHLIRAQTRL